MDDSGSELNGECVRPSLPVNVGALAVEGGPKAPELARLLLEPREHPVQLVLFLGQLVVGDEGPRTLPVEVSQEHDRVEDYQGNRAEKGVSSTTTRYKLGVNKRNKRAGEQMKQGRDAYRTAGLETWN